MPDMQFGGQVVLSDIVSTSAGNASAGTGTAASRYDHVHPGLVPIGGIVAWAKTLAGAPALPSNFVQCDGQVLSDAASPLNGATMPALNAALKLLIGATASGALNTGDAHTHEYTHFNTATSAITSIAGASGSAALSTYSVVWVIRIK